MSSACASIVWRKTAIVAAVTLGALWAPSQGQDAVPPYSLRHVRMVLAGDTMLGRQVNQKIGREGYAYPWGDVIDELRDADLAVINLETTLTTSQRKVLKVFNFKADPDRVQCLLEAGIDICCIANNHILDFDIPGLEETLDVLAEHEVGFVGAGRNAMEARRAHYSLVNGLTVALIGCTDNEPGWEAGPDRPGTFYVSTRRPDELLQAVRDADLRADVVVVTMHWGPNMRERPPRQFQKFARRVIDAGADVFHGHSAHIFQGIEVHNHGLILYDTGDFVDDYMVTPQVRNDLSFLYIVDVDAQGPRQLELIPTRIADRQVNRAVGEDVQWSTARVRRLSKEFGTEIVGGNGVLIVPVRRLAFRRLGTSAGE